MILHGFMLTHNFQTVKQLAESLHESGYTVLTPSLSLGLTNEKQVYPVKPFIPILFWVILKILISG